MTRAEKHLMESLKGSVDAFDSYFEPDDADAPVVSKLPQRSASVTKVKGNPQFSAQFDITASIEYFTLTGGAYTSIAPAALNAALQNNLPMFLFGFTDYKAGFANLQKLYPVNSNWTYGRPGIWGKDYFDGAFDSTVTAKLQNGDLVIPFTSALPGAGTTTLALIIIRSVQVPYGILLDALASDRFVLNMIRYVVPDETSTSLNQYAQNIGLHRISLFGKTSNDYVSPNSFKVPEQQQKNLIDVPIKKGITKEITFASYLNYDVTQITWSTFVWTVKKLD